MKRYTQPTIEVVEIEIEAAVLADSVAAPANNATTQTLSAGNRI